MAENTKTPPNPDQRQRTSQGDGDKPQKPGSPAPGAMPGRQGVSNPPTPQKPEKQDKPNKPEIDPDRNRTGNKPMSPDEIDDDDSTQRMDRD